MASVRSLAVLLLAPIAVLAAGCAQDGRAEPTVDAVVTTPSASSAAWTAATLWATCEQAWDDQRPGTDWTAFEPADPADFAEHEGGLHYVVRYALEDDGGAASDSRDCAVAGTPDLPSVLVQPPLDGLDPSALPAPDASFAVR